MMEDIKGNFADLAFYLHKFNINFNYFNNVSVFIMFTLKVKWKILMLAQLLLMTRDHRR